MPGQGRASLRADCARCLGLCCVAPTFARSADFGLDKPAGVPCPNLGPDCRCRIHDRLRPAGFPGCAAYDCFGAGQKVVQQVFAGQDWRESKDVAQDMFVVFTVVRELHEVLWYLEEGLALAAAAPLRGELEAARDETQRLADSSAGSLLGHDAAGTRRRVGILLGRLSRLVRAGSGEAGVDLAGADLAGRDLRTVDLRASTLRGACLIGADLRGVDLHRADLLGADLRAADLRGADVGTSLFLTQPQVESANGDQGTRLPAELTRPAHWAPPRETSGGGQGRVPLSLSRRPRDAPGDDRGRRTRC